jgi:hypothetical protein
MANSYEMTVNVKTDEKGAEISAHGAKLRVKQYLPGAPSEFFTLSAKNNSDTVSFSVFLHRRELLALHAELTEMVNKITSAATEAAAITPPTTLEPALL